MSTQSVTRVEIKTTRVAIAFGIIPVGGFFHEEPDGHPIKKTAKNRGAYQRWGTRHEPHYGSDELVYVDQVTERTSS